MAPRETENNAYAKFWGDKHRTLWYVMVFLEWSMVTTVTTNNSDKVKTVNADNRALSLSRNKKINCKPSSGRSQENEMLKKTNI